MKQEMRTQLAKTMYAAWQLARLGSSNFGGNAKLYFASALYLTWQSRKNPQPVSIYRKEIGNQLWMDCVPLLQYVTKQGQLYLPGIAK